MSRSRSSLPPQLDTVIEVRSPSPSSPSPASAVSDDDSPCDTESVRTLTRSLPLRSLFLIRRLSFGRQTPNQRRESDSVGRPDVDCPTTSPPPLKNGVESTRGKLELKPCDRVNNGGSQCSRSFTSSRNHQEPCPDSILGGPLTAEPLSEILPRRQRQPTFSISDDDASSVNTVLTETTKPASIKSIPSILRNPLGNPSQVTLDQNQQHASGSSSTVSIPSATTMQRARTFVQRASSTFSWLSTASAPTGDSQSVKSRRSTKSKAVSWNLPPRRGSSSSMLTDSISEQDEEDLPPEMTYPHWKFLERDAFKANAPGRAPSPTGSDCSLHRNLRESRPTVFPEPPDCSTEEDRHAAALDELFLDARAFEPPPWLDMGYASERKNRPKRRHSLPVRMREKSPENNWEPAPASPDNDLLVTPPTPEPAPLPPMPPAREKRHDHRVSFTASPERFC